MWENVEAVSPENLHTAHAWTGGFTSLNANLKLEMETGELLKYSYAGRQPLGCMYHSRRNNSSWDCAKSGSKREIVTEWNAKSQTAYLPVILHKETSKYHGYSHLSGIVMTSRLKRCSHDEFLPFNLDFGGEGWPGSPRSQSRTI